MDNQVVVNVFSFILGAVLGGGSVVVMLRAIVTKVKGDALTKDYLEKLYLSIPVDALKLLIRDVVEVGDAITDGKPNTLPAPEQTTFLP